MSRSEEQAELHVRTVAEDYENFRRENEYLRLPELNEEVLSAARELGKGDSLQAVLSYKGDLRVILGAKFGKTPSDTPRLKGKIFFKCYGAPDFTGFDLGGSKFIKCDFVNDQTYFAETDLTNTKFIYCGFANPIFRRAKFNDVEVIGSYFNKYDPSQDDLNTVSLGLSSWFFDWGKLRFLSGIPLFSISWSTLLLGLAIMNIIGWANIYHGRVSWLSEPVPMPWGLISLMIASVFLTIASTVYRLACPSRVSEISETEWTDKLKNPRLQYFEYRFPRRWLSRAAIIAVWSAGLVGVLLTVNLALERTLLAICYTANYTAAEVCHG